MSDREAEKNIFCRWMPTGVGDGGETKPRDNCYRNMEKTVMKSMARTVSARQDNLTGQCKYARRRTGGIVGGRLVRMGAIGLMLLAAFSTKTSVAEEAVNINLDAGSINLFGFYNGMPKADAEALAAHYGIEVKDWTFKVIPEEEWIVDEIPETYEVYEMNFSLDDIRRISNVPDTVDTFEDFVRFLFRSTTLKISKPTPSMDLNSYSFHCTTSDGVEFKMNDANSSCKLYAVRRYREAHEEATRKKLKAIGSETLDDIRARYRQGIENEIGEKDYD